METGTVLLETALGLFASRGHDAVGVQEIAESAGVTKPTLYHYFGNKMGLLKTLLQLHYDGLTQEIGRAAGYRGDLPATLRRVAAAYFRFSTRDPLFDRMQLSLFFALHRGDAFGQVASLNEEQFTLIEGVFLQASRDHGNTKGRHKVYGASFLGMINTCIGLALNGFLVLIDPLLERAVRQFEHGIYSQAATMEHWVTTAPHPDLPGAVRPVDGIRRGSEALRHEQLAFAQARRADGRGLDQRLIECRRDHSGDPRPR